MRMFQLKAFWRAESSTFWLFIRRSINTARITPFYFYIIVSLKGGYSGDVMAFSQRGLILSDSMKCHHFWYPGI